MIKMFKLNEQRGFSLVELMIVVAIIAILAAIAIPAFMRFALKSKTSEATGNLAAIRTCQEAYRAEDDVYLPCAENPGLAGLIAKPRPWVAPADPPVATYGYDEIGFEPDGDVRYSYLVTVPSSNVFVAVATGDLDGDTDDATFTLTKGDPGYPKPVNAGGEF